MALERLNARGVGARIQLRILTGHVDGRLVLVWPLMEDGPILRMLSPDMLAYRDIIVEPSEDAASWIHQAWSRPLRPAPPGAADPGGRSDNVATAKPVERMWCPVIRLDRFASWDAYATTLPRSMLSDQRRQWKRVQQVLPGLAFRIVDRNEAIPSVIEWVSRTRSPGPKRVDSVPPGSRQPTSAG